MYDSQFPAVHIMRRAASQLVILQKIMDHTITCWQRTISVRSMSDEAGRLTGASLDASFISSTCHTTVD
jgi:hypothetical protein